MWDFLKKAAGAVVEAGAAYVVQSAAVERIINAPDFDTGKAWLRDHVYQIEDETQFNALLTVISTRHGQAKEQAAQLGVNSWGNTFEDRMAYQMAHIKSGVPMRDAEADRMVQIYEAMDHFARVFWQEAEATRAAQAAAAAAAQQPAATPGTPDADASRRAYARMLERVDSVSAPEERRDIPATGPLSEIDGLFQRLDADKRMMSAMMRTMPGQVGPEVVTELVEVSAIYRDILNRGPQDSSLLVRADLMYALGQSYEFTGNACEAMSENEAALDYFAQARAAYVEADRTDGLAALDRKIRLAQAEVDEDDTAVLASLQTPCDDPLDEANRLMDLASYAGRRDPITALAHLNEAEAALTAAGLFPPSGQDLAGAMINAFGQGADADSDFGDLTRQTRTRVVYVGLYKLYEKVYNFTPEGAEDYAKDQEAAAAYRAKWQAIEGSKDNDTFSKMMRGALEGGAFNLK